MRQATIWHPTADAEEAVSSDTVTKEGGGGATRALFAATQENLPLHVLLENREAVSKESEQHEPEGAGGSEGAFELERVEYETGEFLGRRGQLRKS